MMTIPVVILCGGEGTRLQSKTEKIPKPLLQIGDKPLVHHIMDIYANSGFYNFILCLGYKGQQITDYFSGVSLPWNIQLVDTGGKTNTGGRIKKIQHLIDTDHFMVTYGDGLADVDINSILECHRKGGKLATITAVQPKSQFGILELNEEDEIISFIEKPKLNTWINGGFFVFENKVFDYLDDNCVLEKGPFEKLAQDIEIKAYKHNGFWACMDTFKDFQHLNNLWDSGAAPWIRQD